MQRGWIYVLSGLLISSFLGGAIHVFFSPQRTREFIERVVARQQPKFEIEFESAQVLFAGDWWPTVAIELTGLQMRAKEPCITNSVIRADQITVPFELRSLFQKRVRFDHVRAGRVRVFVRPATCAIKPLEEPETDQFAPLERFFQRRWSKEVVNTTRFIEKLSVESLELLRDDQRLAPVIIHNLNLVFSAARAESEVRFEAQLGEPWVGSAPFGRIQARAVIRADEVQLRADGNLKEGQLHLQADWAIDRGEVSLKLSAKDAPATGILRFLHHWDYLRSLNPSLKNQWASCDISMTGHIREFRRLPLHLHQCRFFGDFGDIQVVTQVIPSLEAGGEVRLQIQDIDVKRVLASFGFGGRWGVVSQFGRFSGDLILNNRQTYELKGEVRGAEFYFANLQNQVRQRLDSFALALSRDSERFSGQAHRFFVNEGEMVGGFSFNLSPEGDGPFQVALEKVVFPRLVQKNLWGGRVGNGAVFGKGTLRNSILERFSGQFVLQDWLTSLWELKDVRMPTDYANGVWTMRPTAKRFQLQPESSWAPSIHNLLQSLSLRAQETAFRDLRGQITRAHEARWNWFDVHATAGAGAAITSSGSWSAREGLSGWVQSNGTRKSVTWTLTGGWQKPELKRAAE